MNHQSPFPLTSLAGFVATKHLTDRPESRTDWLIRKTDQLWFSKNELNPNIYETHELTNLATVLSSSFYALAFFQRVWCTALYKNACTLTALDRKAFMFCIICGGRVFSEEGQSCTCPSNLLNKSCTNLGNERARIHNNSISSGNLEVVCTQMWVEETPLKSQLSNAIAPCWFALQFCLYCISLMGSLQVVFFSVYIHLFESITPHVKGSHTYEISSSCSAINYHEKHSLFLSCYSISALWPVILRVAGDLHIIRLKPVLLVIVSMENDRAKDVMILTCLLLVANNLLSHVSPAKMGSQLVKFQTDLQFVHI